RDQDEVIVPPTTYEMDAIRAVQTYGDQVLAQAAAGTAQARTLAHWTVLHFHKRGLSSPEALRCSLRNRRERLQQLLEERLTEFEDVTDSGTEVSVPPDVAKANVLDEDTGERLTDEEVGARTERLVYGAPAQIRRELALLEDVLAKAEKITPGRDNKLQRLLDVVLKERMRLDPKVVIFTRYVDTMTYLADQISRDPQYADVEVLTIHGSLNERQRRETFRSFERARKAVLVATDAISEGINLQHAAAQVIHYELPWNPNRLEQRNGRVDRFGQRKPVVTIRTMVMDETLDAAILKVLVEKAARIRQDYGFSPPYFGDETSILDLLAQHEVTLGPKQLSLFDAASSEGGLRQQLGASGGGAEQDPFSTETLERIKNDSFYGQTHISLPQIEERLKETSETVGSPEAIKRFVFSGLSRFGCGRTQNADGSWRLTITEPALQTASVGTEIPRATFDSAWALDDPDVTLLDVGHPLVRRLIEEVKQDAFRETRHYGRTAYVVTPDVEEVTALFHLLARYVVNTEPTSIIEELLPVAVPVYEVEPSAFSRQRSAGLAKATASSQTRTEGYVHEVLEEALRVPGLNGLLADAVEDRRAELVAERRAMAEQMASDAQGQPAAWLAGIDDVARGTFDLLTVTLLLPA
ncbi:MAG: helicase-related protein, partial [Anaerolineae bacterium]